jgi:hypothetical protein
MWINSDGSVAAAGLQGQAEAAREVILMMMGPRFGGAPADFRERLAAIDEPARLYEILDRVFEVESIDELGLGA